MSEWVALLDETADGLVAVPSPRGAHGGTLLELPTEPLRLAHEADAAAAAAALGGRLVRGAVPRRLVLRGDVPVGVFTVYAAEGLAGTRYTRGSLAGRALAPALAAAVRGPAEATETTLWHVTDTVERLAVPTPTLPPATHTNAYLVGTRRFVLVEPASDDPAALDAIEQRVRARQALGDRLDAILLTHHHPDHVGGAEALRARLSAPLLAHRLTAARLDGRLSLDGALDEGDVVPLGDTALEVLHTPGHAPGHVCLHESRTGAMLVGDMVAGVGTILVEPNDGDMGLYLASLERLSARGASTLLPAHGGVVVDPTAFLAGYVAHRRAREARVLEAARRGRATLAEVAARAYEDSPFAPEALTQLSTAAHLLDLARQGLVSFDGQTAGPA